MRFQLLLLLLLPYAIRSQAYLNSDEQNLLLSFNQYKELMEQQQQQEIQFEIGEDIEVDITSFISQQNSQNNVNQDKFNYASIDCMANIAETSKSNVKHSSNLLNNDMDKSLLFNFYQKNNKYVIIELCDLIKINSLEIGNLEHFSNNLKKFRVSGKKWYDNNYNKALKQHEDKTNESEDNGWIHVGTFDYTTPNSIQFFCVNETKDARPWVKYLKLEILEVEENVDDYYYTPITVLRVFGKDIFNDVEETEREMIRNQINQETDKRNKQEENDKTSNHLGAEPGKQFFYDETEGEFDFCLIKNPFIKYDQKLEYLNNTNNSSISTPVIAKVDYKDNVLESILKKINFLTSYTQLQSNYMELSFNETVKLINDTYFKNFKKKINQLEKKNVLITKEMETIRDHIKTLSYLLILLFTISFFVLAERYISK
ncbi:hypothetical protein QEN19_002911 [Hanseniaspora menglaensis]